MNRLNKISKSIMRSVMPLSSLSEVEQNFLDREDCIRALGTAPKQFSFAGDSSQRKRPRTAGLKSMIQMFSMMRGLGNDIIASFETVAENPKNPKDTAGDTFLRGFYDHAYSLGIGAVGYTGLPHEAVFRDKAVLFEHVIIVAMEMDKQKIDAAPSAETMHMVMDTYYKLGQAVNTLVDYLREHGYAAQGGHPMGGQALYPLMAEKAGMGRHGRHGMIITPQFGPRQRLAAIYCSINNLPAVQENEHGWIADYCNRCGRCISACPVKAIYERPLVRESGIMAHIDAGACFEYFNKNYSCSLCVKECQFNKRPYKELKEKFVEKAATGV